MAAPTVAATATTSISAASATWTVNIPTIVAGDKGKLLFLFARTGANQTPTVPGGWNQIGLMSNEASQQEFIWWRRVVGNEASTLAITMSGSTKGAVCVMLVAGAADPNSKSPDQMSSTAFTGTANANPNPPLNNVAQTADRLYVAFGSWVQNSTVSSYPTGYTSCGYVSSGSAASTDCSIATPWKATTGSSADDPGTYTISASRTWTTRTLAIFPGNYLAATPALGPTITVAGITTKLAALARNFGPTITANLQKQWFVSVTRNFGPTRTVAAVTTKFAAITRNLGPTIVASLNWGIRPLLGPAITVAGVVTRFGALTRNLGPTVSATARGTAVARIAMALGPTVTIAAGVKIVAVINMALGWLTHICAHVNPKFLRAFSEDTLTLTQEAEATATATSVSEAAGTVVVLAEVNMALGGMTEDTRTLTTETEETTEC
jgi:hypothetical protein